MKLIDRHLADFVGIAFGGDGIAASANGDVYADASTFIGLNANVIVELTPRRAVSQIWKP
jgi:hypothetical protein